MDDHRTPHRPRRKPPCAADPLSISALQAAKPALREHLDGDLCTIRAAIAASQRKDAPTAERRLLRLRERLLQRPAAGSVLPVVEIILWIVALRSTDQRPDRLLMRSLLPTDPAPEVRLSVRERDAWQLASVAVSRLLLPVDDSQTAQHQHAELIRGLTRVACGSKAPPIAWRTGWTSADEDQQPSTAHGDDACPA